MINEKQASEESRMKQVIDDNKQTFDLLWQALSKIDDIPEDALFLMSDMSYVAHLFGHQTLLTAVPASVDINNTPKYFAELKKQIQDLRQRFTKTTGQ